MEIRPPTTEELHPLARILAPLPLFVRYGLTEDGLRERWVRALDGGEHLLTAVVDGAPSGLCWYLSGGTFATGAYLRTLAVAPEAQGRGVGARLLQAYEAGAGRPSGGYFLLTSDFNVDAQGFYRRHGYTEVGRLPGFALSGVTELIFWKRP